MADLDDALDALWKVKQWSDAYPLDIFPEANLEACKAKIGESEFSRLHASWARRIVGGIGKIATDALLRFDFPELKG